MESWETRWRKAKGKRGVSPIIATILLVAITVVLAAVLYILVSGYIGGTGSKPLSFSPSGSTPSTAGTGSTTSYYDTLSVSASSGLTTAEFGLKIVGISGSAIVPGAPPSASSCAAGSTFTEAPLGTAGASDCPAVTGTGGTGWYAVLVDSSGKIVATYSGSSWSSTATVSNSDTLVLVCSVQLAGSGDTLSAFGVGGSSVSGSVTL